MGRQTALPAIYLSASYLQVSSRGRRFATTIKKFVLCARQEDRLEKEEDARRAHEGWTRVKDNRRFRLPDEDAFRPGGVWKPPRSVRSKVLATTTGTPPVFFVSTIGYICFWCCRPMACLKSFGSTPFFVLVVTLTWCILLHDKWGTPVGVFDDCSSSRRRGIAIFSSAGVRFPLDHNLGKKRGRSVLRLKANAWLYSMQTSEVHRSREQKRKLLVLSRLRREGVRHSTSSVQTPTTSFPRALDIRC